MNKQVQKLKKEYDESKGVFDKENEEKTKRDDAKTAADAAQKWADDTADNKSDRDTKCGVSAEAQDCKDADEKWKKQKQQKLVYEEEMAKKERDTAKAEFDKFSGEVTSFKEKKDKAT